MTIGRPHTGTKAGFTDKLQRNQVADGTRNARERAGLTQARLADAARIAEQSLSRLERGACDPALSTVWSIAQILGVTLDARFGGTPKPVRSGNDKQRLGLMTLADSLGGVPPRTASLFTRLAHGFARRNEAAVPSPKARAAHQGTLRVCQKIDSAMGAARRFPNALSPTERSEGGVEGRVQSRHCMPISPSASRTRPSTRSLRSRLRALGL